jgi:hypothetical protein
VKDGVVYWPFLFLLLEMFLFSWKFFFFVRKQRIISNFACIRRPQRCKAYYLCILLTFSQSWRKIPRLCMVFLLHHDAAGLKHIWHHSC